MGRNLFDNVMIVLSTIVVVGLLFYIPKNFDFLSPIGKALSDVDLTDVVFSQFRDDQRREVDTNIVIVNIGQANRGEIAQILENINRHEPAAVGIDAFFRQPKEAESDSMLQAAMDATQHLVLVSKVAYKADLADADLGQYDESVVTDERAFDTLETSHPMFAQHASTGFANMIIDQDAAFMTVREVSFSESCAGKNEASFPIRLAQIVDPAAAQRALARGLPKEVINFHGNIESFYHIDVDQALDPATDLSVVRGKVVLLGYCGPNFQTKSLEDNFFTPLNSQYVGRSYPDMFGVVIHANTLAMIRNGDYIGAMSSTTSIVLGLVILVLNVMLFTFLYTKYEVWYDVIAVAVQLGESLLGVFLILYVFNHYNYKLALTPTLVGVALVGTVHDLYQDSIKKIIVRTLARMRKGKRVTSSSQ